MTISVKVEAHPGQDITEASIQAIDLADRLGINVEFDFNGVTCVACPGAKAEQMVESFHRELVSKKDFKIVYG